MEKFAAVFIVIWLLMAIPAIVIIYRGIKKAQRTFAGILDQPILFREKMASGYSKKSFITRVGGANRVLDVIVTESEVCIKGINSIFSFVGSFYDLVHRVSRNDIVAVTNNGKQIDLSLVNQKGKRSDLVLMLKNADQFVSAVTDQPLV